MSSTRPDIRITAKIRDKYQFYKYCYYCERMYAKKAQRRNWQLQRTRDHIVPVSGGGDRNSVNTLECCFQCNNLKSNMLPKELAVLLLDVLENYSFIGKGPRKMAHRYPKEVLSVIIDNLQAADRRIGHNMDLMFRDDINGYEAKLRYISERDIAPSPYQIREYVEHSIADPNRFAIKCSYKQY